MRALKVFVTALVPLFALACSSGGGNPQPDAGSPVDSGTPDAGTPDAGGPADAGDKSAACAATFGEDITPGFLRFDGTVLAVVPPNDMACPVLSPTHLVVQLTIKAQVYRLVVDVLSNQGSPDVWFREIDHDFVGPAWTEGWQNVNLDYPTTLQQNSTDFVEMNEADLVAKITSELVVGAHVSIFATNTSAEPDSAHLIHRNTTNRDGAIVINPESATPHWLLMKFDENVFTAH